MRLTIDIPIFAGPSKAWGNARREIEISWVPDEGDWLELPFANRFIALGVPSPMLVWGAVPHESGMPTVLLDGIVVENWPAAARLAEMLESDFGFELEEYDP